MDSSEQLRLKCRECGSGTFWILLTFLWLASLIGVISQYPRAKQGIVPLSEYAKVCSMGLIRQARLENIVVVDNANQVDASLSNDRQQYEKTKNIYDNEVDGNSGISKRGTKPQNSPDAASGGREQRENDHQGRPYSPLRDMHRLVIFFALESACVLIASICFFHLLGRTNCNTKGIDNRHKL